MTTTTYGREQYQRKDYPISHIAYLAGIVDGEGCLTAGTYAKTTAGNPSHITYLKVSNTEKGLVDWLKDTFGGVVCAYTPAQTAKNSRKKVYMWQTTGDRLMHLCELILPFSVIKKRQIEIMIELRKTYISRGYKKGHRGPNLCPEVIKLREELCEELRSIHSR